MDPLSITASTITVIQSLIAAYDTIKHIRDLPKAFAEVGRNLPLVKETLDLAQQALDADGPDEDVQSAIQPALAECLKRAKTIKDIFAEIEPGRQQDKGGGAGGSAREWSAFVRFYRRKVVPFGKAHKVEALMRDILSKLKVLAIHRVFKAHAESLGQMEKLEGAIRALAEVEPSLPDSEFDGAGRPGTHVALHISDSGRGLVSTGDQAEIAMGNTTKYHSGGGAMNFAYYGHDKTRTECGPKSSPVEWLKHVSKPLDFEKTHAESSQIAQRTPGAGRWFLNSAEFREQWRDGNLRRLWCHGIPGTGKTVLSSIVINHLRARFSSNPEVACVSIYFDHRQHQDHRLTKLLCSVILQLSHGTDHLSAKIQEAHGVWKSSRQMPCERDYLKMLKSQAKGFKRIFFVVDALDECLDDLESNTLNGFLEACRELPDNFRLLFTSRPVTKFATLIDSGLELCITADDGDIDSYLRRFIESRPQLNGIVEKGCKADPSFRDKTLATITDKSHGMFLLAHLHIQSLASTHTLAGFKSGLAQLSTSPDAVYATALERIKKQDGPRRQLAMKALNWLVHAERQLSVDELAHALAIHNGAGESRSTVWQLPKASEIVGIEDALISACVGIVVALADTDINNNNKRIVRLTHVTAGEYIKRNQAVVFPNEDSMSPSLLTRTCLYCLAGLPISNKASPGPSTEYIRQQYPLFGYAANFWGLHLDKATGSKGDLYRLAWRFVSDRPRLDAAVRAMTDPRVAHEANVSGVHVAAFFGLEKLVRKAIANSRDINLNAQTRRGETPLHWAATHGRRPFAEFLIREGADLNAPNADKRTALHKAIMGGGDGTLVDAILAAAGLNLELEDAEGYTCLRWAARYGQLKTVEALLGAGADADAADADGYTALRWAAHEGYKPVIKALVHRGASVGASGRDGWTLLQWAAQEGQDDMVQFLIKRRADPDAADADGLTALRWAMRYHHATTAWLLIQARADVNRADSKGDQPLHAAVRACCGPDGGGEGGGRASTNILWLLLETGADVDAQAGNRSQTPLHLAASAGRGSVVWLLLENGANPRRPDSRNRTALHCAVASGDVEVCRMLLQRDGDHLVHAADQHGQTPLHVAATERSSSAVVVVGLLVEHGADLRRVDSKQRTALHCAIQGEHAEVCQALIQDAGDAGDALVRAADDERRSPLHHAASWGDLAVVGMLLDRGAPVDARDGQGLTALHVAVSQGYEEVADLLLRSGADVRAAVARRKRTAMHIAARLGHAGVVEALLRHGAPVDARDGRGETPLHLAVDKGHGKVRDFLVERGADVQGLDGRGSTPVHQQAVPVQVRVTETVLPASGEERVELNGTPIRNESKSWWKGDKRFAARVEDE